MVTTSTTRELAGTTYPDADTEDVPARDIEVMRSRPSRLLPAREDELHDETFFDEPAAGRKRREISGNEDVSSTTTTT
jgi:hypothetical protein